MSLEENPLAQWHETRKINEDGVIYFLKKYKPDSYEIKNEISHLTSTMINSCRDFSVPKIKEASIREGWVKMDNIDVVSNKSKQEITDWLIKCALELHSLLRTNKPHLRQPVSTGQYNDYLKDYVDVRLKSVAESEFNSEIDKLVADWIIERVKKLRERYFTIVHRDLRARHLLFSQDKNTPTLIDWEFSNVSEPAQDLAKIIYDGTIENQMDYKKLSEHVIDIYAHESHQSPDELEERVQIFLPIIPLEHVMSFISRKPIGYQQKAMSDLCFIRALYEEEK